jgi:hypothetical protein
VLVDDALHHGVERAQRALERLELGELLGGGELPVPEQVGDLLEAAERRELLHRVAAVEQGVRLRVHLRDGGGVDVDTGQALVDLGMCRGGVGHDAPLRIGDA